MPFIGEEISGDLKERMRRLGQQAASNAWRHMTGSKDRKVRELSARLQELNAKSPDDPFVAMDLGSKVTADEYAAKLVAYGFDEAAVERVGSNYVCVHRSQLAEAMQIARDEGYLDEIREPAGAKINTVRCESAEQALEVAKDCLEYNLDADTLTTDPTRLVVIVPPSEQATFAEILMRHDIEDRAVDIIDDKQFGAARSAMAHEGTVSQIDRAKDIAEGWERTPATRGQLRYISSLIRNGELSQEAVGDLEGLTMAQAHEILNGFKHLETTYDKAKAEMETRRATEPGVKEVMTEDRVVSVGTSDKTNPVGSNGQDLVEESPAAGDNHSEVAKREHAEEEPERPTEYKNLTMEERKADALAACAAAEGLAQEGHDIPREGHTR